MAKKENIGAIHKPREVGEPYVMDFGKLVERRHFGSFAIVLTERGALYETYTGYHVWTTPFAADKDGGVQKKSLYAWLLNVVEVSRVADVSPDLRVGGSGITYRELLDTLRIMTEANMLHPMSAFVDEGRAMDFAVKYMDWLNSRYEDLKSSIANPRKEAAMGDEAALALERAVLDARETVKGLSDGNG